MADLRALSFLQPWLWAILNMHKGAWVDGAFYGIENRTRPPPGGLYSSRETFALHASAGWDRDGEQFVLRRLAGRAVVPARRAAGLRPETSRGAIVGTARIAGAIEWNGARAVPREIGDVTRFRGEVDASPWAFGPWVWLLADVRKLAQPIPCKGALGFWRVPDDVAAAVAAHGGRDG